MHGDKLRRLRDKFAGSRTTQAALEFLMTYGWAILVVLVAVGSLSYFGILSPESFAPDKCSLPAGIACLDFRVESYKVIVVLQNSLGDLITVTNVTVSAGSQTCSDNTAVPLKNGERAVITILSCGNGATGKTFNGLLNVTYLIEDKLLHTVSGTLKAKITEGMSISSQSACQNAQTSGLCNGLDIVYGTGYKAACCSEHQLCCS